MPQPAALLLALAAADWPLYGGDAGGQKYSSADEITPATVGDLVEAWRFSTGHRAGLDPALAARLKFQVTPILVEGRLLLCTPFNEVIALDPGSGRALWRFDPAVDRARRPANNFNCRGVAAWTDPQAAAGSDCAARLYTGTSDGRVIALDAATGRACATFGVAGTVTLDWGRAELWPGEAQISSAPLVAEVPGGAVVVVGSALSDNVRVAAPAGTVRAFDARTGVLRWSWDPIPRDASDPRAAEWGEGWRTAGHANVWAPMSVDRARGLVILPTSSPSPDYYGGLRPGDNRWANSVVALRAADGAFVWGFQTVHHDIWDYDLPAQPVLATVTLNGAPRDVVIQGTKQGFVFVLDRDTGAPVLPVEERPVPGGGVPGEVPSPTQPKPADLPPLTRQTLAPDEAFGILPFWDRAACRDAIAAAGGGRIYTPTGLDGTLQIPFTGGGVNWGGVAIDAARGRIYAAISSAVERNTLIPATEYGARVAGHGSGGPMTGAPYGVGRQVLLSPLGLPCNPPPWGELVALDLADRRVGFRSVLGTTEDLAPLGIPFAWGTPAVAGPIVTAGGLVFVGSAMDSYLRAFDAETGREVWQGRLPAPGVATPMTYVWQGRQYVLIAAGGHALAPDAVPRSDTLVAFALPRPGEPGPSLWSRTIGRPGGRFWAGAVLATLVTVSLIALLLRGWARARRRRRAAHVTPGSAPAP